MREILFRGKRKDNGEWVEGDLMQHYVHHDDLTIVVGGCVYYEVNSETVSQFTGLADKNGTKIFEGDIIVMDKYPFYDNGVLSYVGEVVWFENTFSFGFILNCVNKDLIGISTGVTENIEDDMVFEVIGNIHNI